MRYVAVYKLVVGVLLVLVAAELFHLLDADLRMLEEVVVVTALFGSVHLIEGIGLWLSKAWAEALSVVSGSLCLPLEVQEIVA